MRNRHIKFDITHKIPPLPSEGEDWGEGEYDLEVHPHPTHHVGCMTVLNLTWFRAHPPSKGEGIDGNQFSLFAGDAPSWSMMTSSRLTEGKRIKCKMITRDKISAIAGLETEQGIISNGGANCKSIFLWFYKLTTNGKSQWFQPKPVHPELVEG